MTHLLSKYSNWKLILPAFIFFVGFSAFFFPRYQKKMQDAAGEPIAPLDTRFSYTYEDVRSAFERLGVDGRNVYSDLSSRIDMIYPLIYGLLFILVLAWALKKLTRPGSPALWLAFLPVIGMFFDYLENLTTIKLLNSFPELDPESVAFAERMTILKHGFLFLSVALAVLLSITAMAKRVFLKRRAVSDAQTRRP